MRLRFTVIAIVLLTMAMPAEAQRVPTRVTARAVAAICAENVAACLTYVMATIDTTANAAAGSGLRLNFCIPASLRNDQITQEVVRFVRAHPELANENAAGVVLASLRESYPCP